MKLHKLEIARRQLDVAADLYFSEGDYLAVITLAGAAEEILGSMLRRTDSVAMIDHLVFLDKELTGGRSFDTVNKEVNRVRNALKHARDSEEDELIVEPGEAIAMLGRAVVNYVSLTEEATPLMVRVYDRLIELHPDVTR
jgi:hypothetical protein